MTGLSLKNPGYTLLPFPSQYMSKRSAESSTGATALKRPAIDMKIVEAAKEAAKMAIERARAQSQLPVKASAWFDKTVNVSSFSSRRKPHAFQFRSPGIKQEIKEETKPEIKQEFSFSAPPETEWWDAELGEITRLVEHPVPAKTAEISSKPEEARLTPKEMKKLRKLKRQEKVKEIQDKIRMGVLPPPPPKVRLVNLARVLGAAATADPSKIEAQARADAAARLDAHIKRNESRKLSDEERRLKNIKNWAVAEGDVLKIAAFVVTAEIDNQRKFKICKNAQQLQLGGCALRTEGFPLLVVVEGKSKSITRFERLMLRRIKWGEDNEQDDDDEEGDSNSVSACKRVWSGVGEAKNFRKFFWEEPKSEEEARLFLNTKNAGKFWELIPTS